MSVKKMTPQISITRECEWLCLPKPLCWAIFEGFDQSTEDEKQEAFDFICTTRLEECRIKFEKVE